MSTKRLEVRPDLSRRKRWRWLSDGQLHDTPPPPDDKAPPPPEPVTLEAPPPKIPTEPPPASRPAPEPVNRPDVPADFTFSDRTTLRLRSLEIALQAASLRRTGPGPDGAHLLAEAEHIERWINMAALPKEPPRET